MGSTASFSNQAAAGGLQGSHGANNSASWEEQHMAVGDEQLPASCVMDISATLPKLEAMEIKLEAIEDEAIPSAAAAAGMRAASPAPAGDNQQMLSPALAGVAAAAAPRPVLQLPAAGSSGAGSASMVVQAAPGQIPASAAAPSSGLALSMPFATVQQPAALGLQGLLGSSGNGMGLPVTLGQWPAAAGTAAGGLTSQQQALPQMVFIQAPAAAAATAAAAAACTQQQQQQQQLAATLHRAASLREQQHRSVAHAGVSKPSLNRCASIADGSSNSGGKGQISHSTVEKQRRDRLNSLIDELSDIVPPADPKYGNDASSVRRPKHVVLSDTINLLKAMQTKLQIEEAEICTLKQQAAAVTAIAAASHQQQGLAAAAACGSGSPLSPAGSDGCDTGLAALPLAPEGGVPSSGVLVEQGVGCLFVKVNCRDRKGLLSDVVSALRAFPVVICTAAITTTKDGTVHDVFEVRPGLTRLDDRARSEVSCAVCRAVLAASAISCQHMCSAPASARTLHMRQLLLHARFHN
jgi:hypothetical protein